MNNGILAPIPFSTTNDIISIEPLLGVPQAVPTPYHLPTSYDWTIGNNDGFSCKNLVYLIDTTILGSTTVSIPLRGLGGNVLSVDWGDGLQGGVVPVGVNVQRLGSYETVFVLTSTVSLAVISHIYAKHGVYKITIKGVMGLDTLNSAFTPIISVLSYGDINWRATSLNHGSLNLIYVPPVIPATVTSLQASFQNNTRFNHPNVARWDIRNVTNMQQTLAGCSSFNQDLDNWSDKVKQVTNFGSTFSVSQRFDGSMFNWDLGSPTCAGMFFQCTSFTGKGITTWNTSGVTNMNSMFFGCPRLYLGVSGEWNWKTANCTNMLNMFYASRLDNTSLSGWTFNANTFEMFRIATLNNCSFINWSGNNAANMFSLSTLNNCTLSGWRLTSAADTMFYGTAGNNLFVPSWDLRGVTNCSQMFLNSNVTRSGLNDWNVSGVTNMNGMFNGGADFMTANLSNWDISKVTNFTNFMSRGGSLNAGGNASIRIDNWSIASGANLTTMFGDPVASKFVSLSGWSFGGNSAYRMFGNSNYNYTLCGLNCDLSSWNTSGIVDMNRMFDSCGNLSIGNISNWDTSNVTDMGQMFNNCTNFNGSVSGWNTSKVTNMFGMFFNCSAFAGSGLENWNTSNVTNMGNMFQMIAGRGPNANLSGWDTGKVTDMSNMFSSTNNIVHRFAGSGIDNWNVTGVTSINSMFRSNAALNTTLQCNLSGWNLCNCTDMTNFMQQCNIGSGNYDILLNSWEASSTGNPIKPWATGINVHFGTVKYTAASSGARQRLINYGWTITDGGFQA